MSREAIAPPTAQDLAGLLPVPQPPQARTAWPVGAPPAGWPALLPTDLAAAYVGMTVAMWRKVDTRGGCPAPIHVGRCLYWRRGDLDSWIADGCPARDQDREAEYRAAVAGTLGHLPKPRKTG